MSYKYTTNLRKIRGLMAENMLTARGLAKQLGMSDAGLRNKMSGRFDFSIKEAYRMCELLDCEPTEIFFRKEIEDATTTKDKTKV